MNRLPILCCSGAVVAALFASPGLSSDAPDVLPGSTLVLVAKNYDEPAFVPERGPFEPSVKLKTATFDVSYDGFTDDAMAAFQHAVDIWSTLITSPVTIRVEAHWTSLGEDILGNAGSKYVRKGFPGAPDANTYYPEPLADALRGSDNKPGDVDIIANFNSDRDNWYFGTDGNPPSGEWDLVSVVLHEIGHGLGFSGSASVDDDSGSWGFDDGTGMLPSAYDRFTELGDGTAIIDEASFPNPSTDLADALQAGNLFWNGSKGVTANGGPRPRLYSPLVWEPGSSYSHLDETSYPAGHPDSLMTPKLASAEAVHDPGTLALCIFEDIGWQTAEECQATYWVAVSSKADGQNNTKWRSTLGLLNRSSSMAMVDLYFTPADGPSIMKSLNLAGNTHRVIVDIVDFIGGDGNGSLKIVSNQPLIVGSRIFNQGASGTFGQYLDGQASAEGAGAGDTLWLTMLEQNSDFRTNIGFTNTGSTQAKVTITLYDGNGVELVTYSLTIGAGRNKQDNTPLKKRAGRSNIREASAKVTVDSGSGVLIYVSLIDQKTGDATTIPPKE